jgi:pimeloyl-ACP methyl ester carboxylesterase
VGADVVGGSVEIDGLTLAYRRAGRGRPLVLLHGWFCDSRVWRPQLEGLSSDFDVVAWDAPGCGESSDVPAGYRLPDYADAVAELVSALGLERPHLLGLSFGGGLAIEVCRRHPNLWRSLILASAYAGWAGSLPAEEVTYRRERALAETELTLEEWAKVPATYLPGFFASEVDLSIRDELLAVMGDTRQATIRSMAMAFAEADLRPALSAIPVPTLLLYGERDQRAPTGVAEDLHRRIPGSKLEYLPELGHVTNLEAPDRFNAAVRRFLLSVGS